MTQHATQKFSTTLYNKNKSAPRNIYITCWSRLSQEGRWIDSCTDDGEVNPLCVSLITQVRQRTITSADICFLLCNTGKFRERSKTRARCGLHTAHVSSYKSRQIDKPSSLATMSFHLWRWLGRIQHSASNFTLKKCSSSCKLSKKESALLWGYPKKRADYDDTTGMYDLCSTNV